MDDAVKEKPDHKRTSQGSFTSDSTVSHLKAVSPRTSTFYSGELHKLKITQSQKLILEVDGRREESSDDDSACEEESNKGTTVNLQVVVDSPSANTG